jgi:hypothetical protein
MRLLRWTKITLYAQMNLHVPAREPAPATHRQFGRLGNLCQSQQIAKEAPRNILSTPRHRQLDMIDIDKWRFRQASMIAADCP